MNQMGERIDRLLAMPPFGSSPEEREAAILPLLKDELENACSKSASYRNYVQHWPVQIRLATRVADLPYLPVGILKAQPPFALVAPHEIKRVLTSSSTTGQMPSRIALDSSTARRMTKGAVAIAQDFIGSARRPYLVVDVPASVRGGPELGARGAAIQGLQPFANEVTYCLKPNQAGDFTLDDNATFRFAESRGHAPALVYGFTYMIWRYLVEPLLAKNVNLGMAEVYILHSGGWKLLQNQAVDKQTFNQGVARVFGCCPDRVIDFYGMVENVGVIYPDCREGNKHVPVFADILVRNPLTLEPVSEGEQGIVQVVSVLPTSFPGNLLLTADVAKIVAYNGCRCGRPGVAFRFVGRVAKSEIRGCGNIERKRQQAV